jgi:uncharacterized protein (TIGR02588 family)
MADEQRKRSIPQVVTTSISLLLIALLAAAILYEGYASGESRPAEMHVTINPAAAEQRGEALYIPYTVENLGDETVEVVMVTFEARRGDEVLLETETTIDLLGERSTINGMLLLETSDDPATLHLEAQVTSFQLAEE